MDLYQSSAFRYRTPNNNTKTVGPKSIVSHNYATKWISPPNASISSGNPKFNQKQISSELEARSQPSSQPDLAHTDSHRQEAASISPSSSFSSKSSSPADTTWSLGGEWSSSFGSEDSTSVSSDSSLTHTLKSRKRRKRDRRRAFHARIEAHPIIPCSAGHLADVASCSSSSSKSNSEKSIVSSCSDDPRMLSNSYQSHHHHGNGHASLVSFTSLPLSTSGHAGGGAPHPSSSPYSSYWSCYDYEAIRYQQMALNAHYWKAYEVHQQLSRSISTQATPSYSHTCSGVAAHKALSRTISMPPPLSAFELDADAGEMMMMGCQPKASNMYASNSSINSVTSMSGIPRKKALCSTKSVYTLGPTTSSSLAGRPYHVSPPASKNGSEAAVATTTSTTSTESECSLSDSNDVEMSEMPDVEYLTTNRPPQRPWMILEQPDRTRSTSIFTIMSYNILCDKMATRQQYGYCPQWALQWDYRRKAIMDEIKHYNADIISLQEVETEQYFSFFLPELQQEGYEGVFAPKSRAKTMTENERKHVDGCAIFFRSKKFSLTKEHLIEFNQLAMSTADGSEDMLNRVMTKDNVALVVLLETKEAAFEGTIVPDNAAHPLLVCTAHFHWDPEYCDVKLIQAMMLTHELRQLVEESSTTLRPGAGKLDGNAIPLILCGDLNSLPDSGVIEYLSKGKVSADHVDFKELAYKECLKKLSITERASDFSHPFTLERAIPDDIMPFTNYTFYFKGIIDHIFFSKKHFRVLGLLGALDPEWLRENKVPGCPHPHIPSDHFPLLAEFEMDPPALNQANGIRR